MCGALACAASGGRFRGTLGRTLFQTTGLFQSVLKPGVVTNKVRLWGHTAWGTPVLCSVTLLGVWVLEALLWWSGSHRVCALPVGATLQAQG